MNILLINVNGLFGEGLKRLMRDVGPSMTFDTAVGAEQARQKLAHQNYDITLLDLDSIEITQVANCLRVLVAAAGNCPVIALSESESGRQWPRLSTG